MLLPQSYISLLNTQNNLRFETEELNTKLFILNHVCLLFFIQEINLNNDGTDSLGSRVEVVWLHPEISVQNNTRPFPL